MIKYDSQIFETVFDGLSDDLLEVFSELFDVITFQSHDIESLELTDSRSDL